MTLKEMLDTLPGDAQIAVGAGSGYFYLGTAAHFLEKEKALSERIYARLKRSLALAEEQVAYICQSGVSPKRGPRKAERHSLPGETLEQYIARIEYTARRLRDANERAERRRDAVSDFLPLLDREVVRSGPRPVSGDLQIIVAGIEAGDFWLIEEYEEWERTGVSPLDGEEEP